jgi:hypothetical protein
MQNLVLKPILKSDFSTLNRVSKHQLQRYRDMAVRKTIFKMLPFIAIGVIHTMAQAQFLSPQQSDRSQSFSI